MRIGVPREIWIQENRVGLTPAGVRGLRACGHHVVIEQGAGLGAGLTDSDYVAAGAELCPTAEELWSRAELLWKVGPPRDAELQFLRDGLVLLCFLHLAARPRLARALLEAGVVAFGMETITIGDRRPVLAPMSEVAGRLSVQVGARCLEQPMGGRGVLLGGVPGVPAAQVLVLGGGVVGRNAAAAALGLGARVTVLDHSLEVLRRVDALHLGRVQTVCSTAQAIEASLAHADLVIGAVLRPGARTPRLLSREHLMLMKPGAAIVDVSVDQGGCAASTRPTTHDDPSYVLDGVVHYAVPNLPGAVGRTATFALNNASHVFGLRLAERGWEEATAAAPALAAGLQVRRGEIAHPVVAEALRGD